MSYRYSDPERAHETYALPDLEVWEEPGIEILCKCGVYVMPESHATEDPCCPSCGLTTPTGETTGRQWWYWHCFPGCLPESEVYGPYKTEKKALEDAREL